MSGVYRLLTEFSEFVRHSITVRKSTTLLAMMVFWEAFWLAPMSFLTAATWWVLGKRVRARGQFAPLLSRTSRAYDWWCVQDLESPSEPSPPGSPPIIAFVSGPKHEGAISQTLASLASENLQARLVGPDALADLTEAIAGIDWSTSPWLLLMAVGDTLAPGAAKAYRSAIENNPGVTTIFADDDLIDRKGRRTAPHLKPDWNLELHKHHDYLAGACMLQVSRADIEAVADQPDWAEGLIARALASGSAAHLPQILHHRLTRPTPRLPVPPLAIAKNLPRVTVIVPTRNRVDLLSTCIAGLEATNYPSFEVLVVDNDSNDPATLTFLSDLSSRDIRVLRHEGPFNYSAINNRAVAEASGDLICLLNNDIEMIARDWLAIMATQALREEVGAVGAQLLYPDGRIQHAGVVIGVGNAAGHAHRFLEPEAEGYFQRHALPQFVTAVTAACLVVSRERFLAVGGLDETNFPVAFNDVDLCLRLNARGWQSLYEPRAVLIHHESVSRGFDRDPVGAARFAGELAALQLRWHTDRIVDPFHHPKLSRASEQFVLAL